MMTLFPYFSSQFLLLVDAGFLDVGLDPGEVFVVDGTVSVVGEVVVSVVAALAADDLQHNLLVLYSMRTAQQPGLGAACVPGTEDPHKTRIFSPPVLGHLG